MLREVVPGLTPWATSSPPYGLKIRTAEKLRVVLWQPLGQEVEAPPPTLGADPGAPAGPSLKEPAEAKALDDLPVGGVLQEPDRGPILIQPAKVRLPIQQGLEGLFVDFVIPEIGRPAHGSIIKQKGARTGTPS